MTNLLTEHQSAALNIDKHIALTANAGSGKTFVLSRRFLEIALSGNVPLRKIAAITFTEKAASELYRKVALQLEEMLNVSDDQVLNENLNRIRRGLVSANISTIHSFCINLLREFPVEAELDANFTPVDTSVSGELAELAVEEVIKESLNSPADSDRIKSLIRLFSSRKIFSGELMNLLSARKNLLSLKEKIYSRPTEEVSNFLFSNFLALTGEYLTKSLPGFITSLENIIQEVFLNDRSNSIARDAEIYLKRLKEQKDTESRLLIIRELSEIVCTQKSELKSRFIKKAPGLSQAERSLVEGFCKDVKNLFIPDNHKVLEDELAESGKNLIYFFERALEKYDQKKSAKGYLDFEDILLYTKKVIEDPVVRASVWEKFDYIMIDEYQDTNEIQYEIFLPILDYLKRGNLFVVGDEKQSIYMFRDAELEVFEKTRNNIGSSLKGEMLLLPDSFRMGEEIALFTNYIFRRLFSDPYPLFNEVSHNDLVCARQEQKEGGVEFLLEDESEGTSEAELISKRILQLRDEKNISWESIAVLSRKRKSFDELEESFIKYNIPYLIMGGRNFYQRQSIYDIYNYFSFLLDNSNDAALAGVLRSPFFNLSDAQLYTISLSRGDTFYQKLVNTAESLYQPVKEKLSAIAALSRFTEAPVLLRKILEESGFTAYLASKKNGIQETANIQKLIRVTIDYYSQGFRTLYDYVSFLRMNIEQTEDESQALIADDSNTVKIMTIHQAKGLEFPVVFLYKCSDTSQRTMVKQKSIIVNKSLGILTKVPLKENYFEDYCSPPVVNLNNFIASKKSSAELKRLLYVGITRAKDYLFITAAKKDNYKEDSFMGLLMQALSSEFCYSSFEISDTLMYLKKVGESYIRSEETLTLRIPVTTKTDNLVLNTGKRILERKKILTERINDYGKQEIISATRFSVYTKCPLKYRFTYLDGLLPLVKTPSFFDIENEGDDDVTAVQAGTKGKVIHKILQKEKEVTSPEEILRFIINEDNLVSTEGAENLGNEILSDLQRFYNSECYKNLKSGLNEYEVYYNQKDYILFGIIDKLIIDGERITIVDYKTDNISEEEIDERAGEYFNQLKFYSYIICNTFYSSYRIFIKIIFIKHPDKFFEKEELAEELIETGRKIEEMITRSRNNIFNADYSHCSKCIYSPDHKNCIKKREENE